MKIIMGGDTHGDRNQVRWLLDKAVKHEAAGVFVLGDFGVWDHMDAGTFTNGVAADAQRKGLKVWFLPGNHENYDLLEIIEKERPRDEDGFVVYHEGLDSLLYSPRGHRWTWDGVAFLSLGGAYSVDKHHRVVSDAHAMRAARERVARGQLPRTKERWGLEHGDRLSWWPQEEITEDDVAAALLTGTGDEPHPDVDVMLAHDKPMDAELAWNRKDFPETHANQQKLQQVVDAVRPSLYLHGHFHYAYQDHLLRSDTQVFGLDCEPDGSRSCGGSGDRKLSWGILEARPNWSTFSWQESDGTMMNRDFPSRR